jgi:hypothetical protein
VTGTAEPAPPRRTPASWDRPEMQAMIVGAMRWALTLVDADVTPRSLPR